MKNKKIIITLAIIISLIFIIIFVKNNYKKDEFGNNITNKSIQQIEDYILNISGYGAKAEIEIQSNKNTNKYVIHQKEDNNVFEQEVLEPQNIAGVKIKYENGKLTVENTSLELSKIYEKYENITLSLATIYENYQGLEENRLDLIAFIEDYKSNNESKIKIDDEYIVLETKNKNENERYNVYKTMYCNKHTMEPVKLEIRDENKKIRVYISYKEIQINSLEEGVLAFKLKNMYYKEY